MNAAADGITLTGACVRVRSAAFTGTPALVMWYATIGIALGAFSAAITLAASASLLAAMKGDDKVVESEEYYRGVIKADNEMADEDALSASSASSDSSDSSASSDVVTIIAVDSDDSDDSDDSTDDDDDDVVITGEFTLDEVLQMKRDAAQDRGDYIDLSKEDVHKTQTAVPDAAEDHPEFCVHDAPFVAAYKSPSAAHVESLVVHVKAALQRGIRAATTTKKHATRSKDHLAHEAGPSCVSRAAPRLRARAPCPPQSSTRSTAWFVRSSCSLRPQAESSGPHAESRSAEGARLAAGHARRLQSAAGEGQHCRLVAPSIVKAATAPRRATALRGDACRTRSACESRCAATSDLSVD